MKVALLSIVKVAALTVAFRATLAVDRTAELANEHGNAETELSLDEQVIMRKMITGTATSEESRLITDKLARKMKNRRAEKMAKQVKTGDGEYTRRELQKMKKRVDQGLATSEEIKIVEESKAKEQKKLLQKIKQAKSRRRGGGERSREESPRISKKKNKKGAIKVESLLDLQSETKEAMTGLTEQIEQSSNVNLKKNEETKEKVKSNNSKKSKNKKSKNKNQKSRKLVNVEKNIRKTTSKQKFKELKAEDDNDRDFTRKPNSSKGRKATIGNFKENHGSKISVQSKPTNKNSSTEIRPKIQPNEQMEVDADTANYDNIKVTKQPKSMQMNRNKITAKQEKVTHRMKNKTKPNKRTRVTEQPKPNKKNNHIGKQEKIKLKVDQQKNEGKSDNDNTVFEMKTGENFKKQSNFQIFTNSPTTKKTPVGKSLEEHSKQKSSNIKSQLSSGSTINNRNQSDITKKTLQLPKLTNDDFVNSFDDKIKQLSIKSKIRGANEETLKTINPNDSEKETDKTIRNGDKRQGNSNPNNQKESKTKGNEKKTNSEMSQNVKKPTNTIELPPNEEIANVINTAEAQNQMELYDIAERLKEFNKLQSSKNN